MHLEVSFAITLTGSAHLLHGDASSPTSGGRATAASSTLWLVAPTVSVADRSTLQVVGSVSVDGGPTGSGLLAVRDLGSLTVMPKPVSAASYVFNVETVQVIGGGSLTVTRGGSLTVTGRGTDPRLAHCG